MEFRGPGGGRIITDSVNLGVQLARIKNRWTDFVATLNTNEKQVLEKLFQMGSGFVLNFSDRTMSEFFRDDIAVEIYDEKYRYASGSKANCLRGFWQVADDSLVGRSIDKLIEYIQTQILLGSLKREDFPAELIHRATVIASRLQGGTRPVQAHHLTEEEFISRELEAPSIERLQFHLGFRNLRAATPLSDIFISYSRSDRATAQTLANALLRENWSVWWDPKIPPGKAFDEVIDQALEKAKCVIVLWSKASVKSGWIKAEAAEGNRRGILLPALIEDDAKIPSSFATYRHHD